MNIRDKQAFMLLILASVLTFFTDPSDTHTYFFIGFIIGVANTVAWRDYIWK